MTLELFTATGALLGGLVAFLLPEKALELLFAGLLVYTAHHDGSRRGRRRRGGPDARTTGRRRRRTPGRRTSSSTRACPARPTACSGSRPGRLGSVGAGVVSALLGIGGGIVKVPVMHLVMGVPLRVATATSNLMMGITASAGAIIYLSAAGSTRSSPAPTAIGVFVGASIGSRVAHRIDVRILRGLFVAILLYTAFQMLQRAFA